MRIRLKYFGVVAEKTSKEEEDFELDNTYSLIELRSILETKYNLKGLAYNMAVNRTLNTDIVLKEDDEVALLPPYAGG